MPGALTRAARAAAAAVALATSVAGVPALLAGMAGWPLPRHVPTAREAVAWLLGPSLGDPTILRIVICVGWVLWAAWTWSVIVAAHDVVRYRHAPLPVRRAGFQALAVTLLATISLNLQPAQATPFPAATDAHQQAVAGHDAAMRTVAVRSGSTPITADTGLQAVADGAPAETTPPARRAAASHHAAQRPGAAALTPATIRRYTVRDDDTLSDIAADQLRDAGRWPEIFHLNRGLIQRDGQALTDPDLIQPGWVFVLPATVPSQAPPAAPHPPMPGDTDDGPSATPNPSASPDAPVQSPRPDATAPSPSAPLPSAPAVGGSAPAPTSADGDGSTPPASPAPSAEKTREAPARTTAADLPGIGWLEAGLVAALLLTLAMLWRRRQRAYRARAPQAALRLDDRDVGEPSPTLTRLRRHLATRSETSSDLDASTDLMAERGHPDGNAVDGDNPSAKQAADADRGSGRHRDTESPRSDAGGPAGLGGVAETARESAPQDQQPSITVIHRSGSGRSGRHPAELQQSALARLDDPDEHRPDPTPPATGVPERLAHHWPDAGLGLTGAGAYDAARALVVSALTAGAGTTGSGGTPANVIIPEATLLALCERALPPALQRLHVTANVAATLDLLSEQVLARTRVLDEYDVATPADLRRLDPLADPLSPILLLCPALTAPEQIASLLTTGARLDIHGLLLGTWPAGHTISVAADGTTTEPRTDYPSGGRHAAPVTDLGRLSTLSTAAFLDLLHVLAEAHADEPAPTADPGRESVPPLPPGLPQPSTPQPSAPQPSTRQPAAPSSARTPGTSPRATPDPQASRPSQTAAQPAEGHSASDDLTERHGREEPVPPATDASPHARSASSGPDPAPTTGASDVETTVATVADAASAPIGVTILGGVRIGPPDAPFSGRVRSKSLQILVYLSVNGGAASLDAMRADLVPDIALSASGHHLQVAVSALRGVLNQVGGKAARVSFHKRGYQLIDTTLDVDLWRLRDAIAEAATASDDRTRIEALRRAVGHYRGPLADGYDWEWLEPYREAVRRQVIDAYVALADLLQQRDPGEALAVLFTALEHAPYTEDLYRRAMRLAATTGDALAIRSLRRTLTQRLGEIDLSVSDETSQLADQLLARFRRTR